MRQPVAMLLVLGAAAAFPAGAAFGQELYAFGTNPNDGKIPYSGVLPDAAGNLYGVTTQGGSPGAEGIAYELSPPAQKAGHWDEKILWNFKLVPDDVYFPTSDLLADSSGNYYGVGQGGGAYDNNGGVFELSPPASAGAAWTERVLFSFNGSDGSGPYAGLIADAAGNLYGTTIQGGYGGGGVVFELVRPTAGQTTWTEEVLWAFQGPGDAQDAQGRLVMDAAGNLYGTTTFGGLHNEGTVFEVSPPASGVGPWTQQILVSLDSATGEKPQAGLTMATDGRFVGTASVGGASNEGTVFSLTPPRQSGAPWSLRVLHTFTGFPDGAQPFASVTLTPDGDIHGTTINGGANCYPDSSTCGTVFDLAPPAVPGASWTEKAVYSAGSTGPAFPESDLSIGKNHAFYGTTSGATYTHLTNGDVFSMPQ